MVKIDTCPRGVSILPCSCNHKQNATRTHCSLSFSRKFAPISSFQPWNSYLRSFWAFYWRQRPTPFTHQRHASYLKRETTYFRTLSLPSSLKQGSRPNHCVLMLSNGTFMLVHIAPFRLVQLMTHPAFLSWPITLSVWSTTQK